MQNRLEHLSNQRTYSPGSIYPCGKTLFAAGRSPKLPTALLCPIGTVDL